MEQFIILEHEDGGEIVQLGVFDTIEQAALDNDWVDVKFVKFV